MAKEYRISATIVLPANEIEAAHVLVKLHPVVEQFQKSLTEISKNATVEHGSHKPRQKKEKASG